MSCGALDSAAGPSVTHQERSSATGPKADGTEPFDKNSTRSVPSRPISQVPGENSRAQRPGPDVSPRTPEACACSCGYGLPLAAARDGCAVLSGTCHGCWCWCWCWAGTPRWPQGSHDLHCESGSPVFLLSLPDHPSHQAAACSRTRVETDRFARWNSWGWT